MPTPATWTLRSVFIRDASFRFRGSRTLNWARDQAQRTFRGPDAVRRIVPRRVDERGDTMALEQCGVAEQGLEELWIVELPVEPSLARFGPEDHGHALVNPANDVVGRARE